MAKYSNGSTKKPNSQKTTSINDEILANIPDPTIRVLVRMLMAQNKKLKRENLLLKEETTFTIDMRKSENENLGINIRILF